MAAVLKWTSLENNTQERRRKQKNCSRPTKRTKKSQNIVLCVHFPLVLVGKLCVCEFILVWQFILCIQLKAIVWKNEVLQSFFGFCCLWLLLWPFCISCECESLFCIEEHSFLFNHVCDFRKFMLKIRTMKIDKRKHETLLYAWNCFLLKLIGCNKFCNLIY